MRVGKVSERSVKREERERGKPGASTAAQRGRGEGSGAVPVWAACPRGGSVRPGLELPVVSSWHGGVCEGQDHPRGREEAERITNTSRPLAEI